MRNYYSDYFIGKFYLYARIIKTDKYSTFITDTLLLNIGYKQILHHQKGLNLILFGIYFKFNYKKAKKKKSSTKKCGY